MLTQDLAMTPETLSFLHDSRKTHLIGGQWADSKDEKTAEVFDPSTGEVITTVLDVADGEVGAATPLG